MNKKPNILIFIDWFLPGFKAGGPIKSVSNIVNALHKDFNFFIVTSDRDLNDSSPYKNIKLNEWVKTENYSIIYLTPDRRDKWIKEHLQNSTYTHYYFNSIFSKHFTLLPVKVIKKLNLSEKVVIAPRGMLGKGALSIKPFKKKLFLTLTKLLAYFKNVTWHATNTEEKEDITNVFGNSSKIKIASNISFNTIKRYPIEKLNGNLKLVFLSRISPKKNLYYALELIKNIEGAELTIYGSIEDIEYWQKCQSFIKNNNINAHFKGELHPAIVQDTLANFHFLIFPTLHENFGHVIVESIVAGCGLIISNNTPWIKLEDKKIGWDIDLSQKDTFKNVILHCINMDQEEYDSYRNNCYTFVENELNSDKEVVATKEMFIK